MTGEARTLAEQVRENVSHVARGCRASTAHNPAPYVNDIEAALDELVAECERLTAERDAALRDAQAEAKHLREHSLLTAYTLDHVIHAMRAAWIEWKHGGGADAALVWIENTLDGPDQIPDVAETGSNAQAYFDREIAASRKRESAARAALAGSTGEEPTQ